jgi:PRTRC genetic system protein E
VSEVQTAPGLMQALAPIVTRRPVHIIASPGAEGAIHLVIQPLRVDDTEDAEIGAGFAVEAPPAELDADLPRHIGEFWVPAQKGLQSVLDQVRAAAEATRTTTVAKAKDGKSGGKKGAVAPASGGQTSLLAPGAEASDAAPAAADQAVAAPIASAPAHAPAGATPLSDPSAEPITVPGNATPANGAVAAQDEAPTAADTPADGVSGLFD